MVFRFRCLSALLCSLVFLFPVITAAQILEKYPYGQGFYDGGLNRLNEELKEIARAQSLKPCAETGERYPMAVLVNPDGRARFIKDFDTLNIQRNKCAYEMSRKLFPHLKGWRAATVDGKPVKAVAMVNIVPNVIFSETRKVTPDIIIEPNYKKGNGNFHSQVKHILESSLAYNVDRRKVELAVVISPDGKIDDVQIRNTQLSEINNNKLAAAIKSIKGVWRPGSVNGIPVRYTLLMNFQQDFNFDMERESEHRSMPDYRGF
ncbi:energy transducer TonB [Chryseobacterium sp.]|uniref:energy transducer TonB n=1 Tax=Chryseobacterium sp. TaxID=1871047 RepID=UPI0012A803D4|nr:hypothetical protein [Chryseobacterium sp.]QFG54201.1 hypothetical protein F7R58_11825 [Chryseobacterium sp.]